MRENPLVTILTPVYNSPDLFQTLESVRQQIYRPIQYILIDDASECYEEEPIREFFSQVGEGFTLEILRNAQNIGTVRTLNRGLSIARGKYVFSLAGDDAFFDERVIADWVAAFEEIDCDVLTARRAVCDNKLENILEILPSEETMLIMKSFSARELFEYLAQGNKISGSCTAWRLDSLRRMRLYDEHYRLMEDYPTYLRLLREGGKILFLDRVVIRYRRGGVSTMKIVSETLEHDVVQIWKREIIPFVQNPFKAKLRLIRWQRSVRFDRWYYREQKKNCNSVIKECSLRVLYGIYHPKRSMRKMLSIIHRPG